MAINNSSQPQYIQDLTTWSSYPYIPINGPFSWTGNAAQAATIGYTFDASKSFYSGDMLIDNKTVLTLTSGSQGFVTTALAEWSKIAGLTFEVDNSTPSLVFGEVEDLEVDSRPANGAFLPLTISSGSNLNEADILLNDILAGQSPGGAGYETILHEIGHSLGISHPGGGDGSNEDFNRDQSIMSDNNGNYATSSTNAITPMIYDIAAVQFLYGANRTVTSGTNYTTSGNNQVWTIWDAGGIDTIDASGVTGDHIIDLRGGVDENDAPYFSEIGDERIAIAFDPENDSGVVDIEAAVGGDGNDSLIGGVIDNTLTGGADTGSFVATGSAIEGDSGISYNIGHLDDGDTLEGGEGIDIYSFTVDHSFEDSETRPTLGLSLLEGFDTIIDSDGEGVIKFDDIAFQGTATLITGNPADNSWYLSHDSLSGITYSHILRLNTAGDLELRMSTRVEEEERNDETVIKVIKNFKNGDLGILLPGAPLNGTAGNDSLEGSETDDNISGLDGNDLILGAGGDDTVNGGNGTDTASFAGGAAVNVNLLTNTATGQGTDTLISIESAIGSSNADTITGSTAANTISGGDGADSIASGSGADSVDGGIGNDTITGLSGNDTIIAGVGADSVNGEADDDSITGGDGNDTLLGSSGNDTIYGGADHDSINAGSNDDIMFGDAGDDTLKGFDGADSLSGGADADDLRGENGNDTLDGGAGVDKLTGDTGSDVFLFSNVAHSVYSTPDRVMDFTQGTDLIDLSGLGFTGIQAGAGTSTVLGYVFSDATDRTYITNATNTFRITLENTQVSPGIGITLTSADFDFT